MIADYGAFAVNADAKWNNLNELFEDMKKDPSSISIVGTSAPGSMDHIQFVKVAKAAGVDVKKIKYVSDQDGGSYPAIERQCASVLHWCRGNDRTGESRQDQSVGRDF